DLLSAPAEQAAKALSGLGGAADAAKTLLPGVTVAAAGMTAALGLTVKTASDFEETMSGVKAVMSPEEVNRFGGSLEKLALQLGKDTAFSAKEAAAGIEELIKGGLTAEDVLNGAAKSTLALAAAGGVSLPDAATIAANALAQFNLKGEDMAHVADLIAGAANASAIDVGQFKFSLQAAGAVASTVGFSFDDLAQAIAIMGKAGIAGSDAGTSLKTMMMSLQPATNKAAKEFANLGLITEDGANRFFTAEGRVKSMAEVADILQQAMADLTEQQRLASLEVLFGSDAVRAGAILAKEGAEGFNAMAESMGKVTAEAVGAARLDNLNGSLKQLGGSLETVQIEMGQKLIPLFRPLIDGATGVLNAFLNLSDQWKSAIAIGAVVATGLTVLTAAGLGLLAIIPSIVAGWTAVSTITGITGATITGLLGPIGLVIAAGALLTAAWTNNWGDIQGKTTAVWEFLQTNVFQPIAAELSWFGDRILPDAALAWETMTGKAQAAWTALQAFLQPAIAAFGRFWETHHDTISRVLNAAWDGMTLGVRVAWELLQGIVLGGLRLLQGDWEGAWGYIREHLGIAWGHIQTTIGTNLQLIAEGLLSFGHTAWALMQKVGGMMVQGVLNGLSGLKDAVVGAAEEAIEAAGEALKKFKPSMPNLLGSASEAGARAGAALRGRGGEFPAISPTPWASPVPGASVTQEYGKTPWSHIYPDGIHTGIDLAAQIGRDVFAAAAGTVTRAGWDTTGYGNLVAIAHANGLSTLYGHLNKVDVRPGQQVSAGQDIGDLGNTGNSSGPHVHLELLRNGLAINPRSLIPAFAEGVRGFAGGLALVGEQGPEIVGLPRGADVYSHRESRQMVGGDTIHVHVNVEGSVMREKDLARSIAVQIKELKRQGWS
ncbi:MAG TPA: phage tail tape measure protein, partial [Chloroflexota bacterium]|nr:phage tail tape measure protein [Chloroflexota bacterium]